DGVEETDATGRPNEGEIYLEIIFPTSIPASLLSSMFTFQEEVDLPDWSFQRMYITFDEKHHALDLKFISNDERKQVTAVIEKSEMYEQVKRHMNNINLLTEYVRIDATDERIYIPKDAVKMEQKTFVASKIEAESFINALFSNPSLVTPNMREAYFTDGQRGLRIIQDGNRLEYINPIQPTLEKVPPPDLLERS